MKKFLPIIILIVASLTFVFVLWKIFPIKYKGLIVEYSVRYELAPELVGALINVESGFDKDAVSSAGAVGLMQVLPTTADEVAKRINLTTYNLKNEDDNIAIGCYYLKYLMDYYEGDVVYALCAYNAGLNNVKYWDFNGDIEKIPVLQTKNYVKKIMRYINVYRNFYF